VISLGKAAHCSSAEAAQSKHLFKNSFILGAILRSFLTARSSLNKY
jgi:hypothetical protein